LLIWESIERFCTIAHYDKLFSLMSGKEQKFRAEIFVLNAIAKKKIFYNG